jgi:nucleotide-binding universal stress UspA family protein
MVKTIVVGTDGSDTAGIAVDEALSVAQAYGARLVAVSAYHPGENVDQILDGVKAKAEEAGVEVEGRAVEGDPVSALLDTAEGVGADLLVVGNRGMHGPRRFLGSVPNNVSHEARCNVYIVQTT